MDDTVIQDISRSSWRNLLSPNYKSRSDEFHKLFCDKIPKTERLVADYACALHREILLQGRIYISINYIAFYSNIFTWITKLVIRLRDISEITKANTAKIIPNAIQIITNKREKHVFASFVQRDKSYVMLLRIWQNNLMNERLSSQEIQNLVHFSYGKDLGMSDIEELNLNTPESSTPSNLIQQVLEEATEAAVTTTQTGEETFPMVKNDNNDTTVVCQAEIMDDNDAKSPPSSEQSANEPVNARSRYNSVDYNYSINNTISDDQSQQQCTGIDDTGDECKHRQSLDSNDECRLEANYRISSDNNVKTLVFEDKQQQQKVSNDLMLAQVASKLNLLGSTIKTKFESNNQDDLTRGDNDRENHDNDIDIIGSENDIPLSSLVSVESDGRTITVGQLSNPTTPPPTPPAPATSAASGSPSQSSRRSKTSPTKQQQQVKSNNNNDNTNQLDHDSCDKNTIPSTKKQNSSKCDKNIVGDHDDIENSELFTECDCKEHLGHLIKDQELDINVDTLFTLIFTNSKFMRAYMERRGTTDFEMTHWRRAPGDTSNSSTLSATSSKRDPNHRRLSGNNSVIENNDNLIGSGGLPSRKTPVKIRQSRQLNYSLNLNHMWAKQVQVEENQRICQVKEGTYVLMAQTENSGIPYGDAFTCDVTYCLTRRGRLNKSRMLVHCVVNFKKEKLNWKISMIKNVIERQTVQSVTEFLNELTECIKEYTVDIPIDATRADLTQSSYSKPSGETRSRAASLRSNSNSHKKTLSDKQNNQTFNNSDANSTSQPQPQQQQLKQGLSKSASIDRKKARAKSRMKAEKLKNMYSYYIDAERASLRRQANFDDDDQLSISNKFYDKTTSDEEADNIVDDEFASDEDEKSMLIYVDSLANLSHSSSLSSTTQKRSSGRNSWQLKDNNRPTSTTKTSSNRRSISDVEQNDNEDFDANEVAKDVEQSPKDQHNTNDNTRDKLRNRKRSREDKNRGSRKRLISLKKLRCGQCGSQRMKLVSDSTIVNDLQQHQSPNNTARWFSVSLGAFGSRSSSSLIDDRLLIHIGILTTWVLVLHFIVVLFVILCCRNIF